MQQQLREIGMASISHVAWRSPPKEPPNVSWWKGRNDASLDWRVEDTQCWMPRCATVASRRQGIWYWIKEAFVSIYHSFHASSVVSLNLLYPFHGVAKIYLKGRRMCGETLSTKEQWWKSGGVIAERRILPDLSNIWSYDQDSGS